MISGCECVTGTEGVIIRLLKACGRESDVCEPASRTSRLLRVMRVRGECVQ
jgi:hypothetical protein